MFQPSYRAGVARRRMEINRHEKRKKFKHWTINRGWTLMGLDIGKLLDYGIGLFVKKAEKFYRCKSESNPEVVLVFLK